MANPIKEYTQYRAAKKAGKAQQQAAEAGIEEQRRQFDLAQQMMQPFREAGLAALGGLDPYREGGAQAYQQQLALAGLLGPEAEAAAIERVQMRPGFQSEIDMAEQALLQQASATGGLRGGNIQGALAQFRPQMLRQAIEQEYGRFGGLAGLGAQITSNLTNLGQASAAGTAGQAMNLGQSIAGLRGQQGAAMAGVQLAKGQALGNVIGAGEKALGKAVGSAFPSFGNLFGE